MSTEPRPLKVFLCHAQSDENAVRTLYRSLTRDGVDAWSNRENLIPGQEPDREIRRAVRESDAVVFCLSGRFNQAGSHQREARLALDTAMEQPEGEIFIIPARLEQCDIPESLQRFQWVDLFDDQGYEKLMRSLRLDAERKKAALPESRDKPVKEVSDTMGHAPALTEQPELLQRLLKRLKRLRFPFDLKYLAIPSLLIALFVLLFGNNIYEQMTGHSIFAEPATSTPTVTATFTVPPTATNALVPTDTPTPVPPTATQTLVPPTDTLVPTVTVVPPARLGEDWLAGCISTLWIPYPASITSTEREMAAGMNPCMSFLRRTEISISWHSAGMAPSKPTDCSLPCRSEERSPSRSVCAS